MGRPHFSAPDSFSLFPMLALLPVRGSLKRLEQLTSSLYARYEKVTNLRKEIGVAGEVDREVDKRLVSEEAMLRQVLDWLELKPEV